MDTWEPRSHLHPDMVTEFLKLNGKYRYVWPGARCGYGDKPCKNRFGVKIHQKYCHMVDEGSQQFKGTVTEKKVVVKKLEELKKSKPTNG